MKPKLLVAVVLVPLALAPSVVASASQSRSTTSTTTEAWYATLPSVSPRPAGTLHVGLTAGLEDSRTYLALDMSGVPSDVTSGTLDLPIDAPDSSAPDTAVIDVCLAGDPGPSVEGSTDSPPPVDCSVRAPAKVGATALTVDLTPFLGTLRTSGLALVPTAGGSASWHVAIFGRKNPRHITATFASPEADAVPVVASPPTTTTEVVPVFSAPGNEFASPAPFRLPPVPARRVPVRPVPSLGPPVRSPIPARSARYADSFVFTLPLVLLALLWYFGGALTRPVVVPEPTSDVSGTGLREPRRSRRRALAARAPRASE